MKLQCLTVRSGSHTRNRKKKHNEIVSKHAIHDAENSRILCVLNLYDFSLLFFFLFWMNSTERIQFLRFAFPLCYFFNVFFFTLYVVFTKWSLHCFGVFIRAMHWILWTPTPWHTFRFQYNGWSYPCKLFFVQCTLYTVHGTLYTAPCTGLTKQSKLLFILNGWHSTEANK